MRHITCTLFNQPVFQQYVEWKCTNTYTYMYVFGGGVIANVKTPI